MEGDGSQLAKQDGNAGVIEALKIVLPTADMASDRKVVLLGAAASGKSCLLKRVLVTAAENYCGGGGSGSSSSNSNSSKEGVIIPLLILLIDLGRLMTKHGLTHKNNLVEWYDGSLSLPSP